MNRLENKIPPPLIAFIFAGLIWWLSLLSPYLELNLTIRVALSAIIITTGLFFCLSGIMAFRRAKTTVDPLKPETASSLVISGIYQISRNPMYLGVALCLLALAVYLSSPVSLLGVVGFILYMNAFQIKPEERILQEIFGSEFSSYQLKVRRWI